MQTKIEITYHDPFIKDLLYNLIVRSEIIENKIAAVKFPHNENMVIISLPDPLPKFPIEITNSDIDFLIVFKKARAKRK